MYQEEEKLEYMEVANDFARWATTRFGYFVKANKTNEEKIELVQALAEELAGLPKECMSHIEKAKARWMKEGHTRSPLITQILQMLREFNNREQNSTPKIEYNKGDVYGVTAQKWDGTKTDDQKRAFLKTFRKSQASPATKWVIREWMRGQKYNEPQITVTLGGSF